MKDYAKKDLEFQCFQYDGHSQSSLTGTQNKKRFLPLSIVLSIAPRPVLYSKGTTCSKKIANVLSLAFAPKDNHSPTTHVQGLKRSGIGNTPEQSSQN